MLKGTAYFILALILIGAGLYAAAPVLMNRAIPAYLESQGIRSEFRFGRPGLSGMTVDHARVQTQSMRVEASNVVVGYSLASLLNGRASDVAVARLSVMMGPSEDSGDAIEIPSPWLLIPADRMRVDVLHVENREPAVTLTGDFEFDSDRARATLLIDSPTLPTSLDASLQLDPAGGMDVTLTQPGNPPALKLSGVPEDDAIFIDGAINLADETFGLLAGLALPGDLAGHWRGTFRATAPWPVRTTLDLDAVTANGSFDFALSGSLPEADGIDLKGDITASLARGNVQVDARRIAVRAGSVTVDGTPYQLGEDSRLDMTLNSRLPAGSLSADFLSELNATLQTSIDISLSSEAEAALARHASVTGELTTTLADGRINTRMDKDAAVDLVLPSHEIGFRVREPFSVNWNPKTGVIDTADASLQVRLPEIEWLDQRLAFRDARADITELRIDRGTMDMHGRVRTNDSTKAVPVNFAVKANLDNWSGTFDVSTDHEVSRALLENDLPGWQSDYDLDSGTLEVSVAGRFHETDAGMDVAAEGEARLADGVAHYDDMVALGINATSPISFDTSAWRLGPGSVNIDTVDVGVPLANLGFEVDTNGTKANIADLSADVLAGQVRVEEIDYDIDREASQFEARVTGVSLATVLAMAGEKVDGSGTLDGVLPVTLGPQGAAIDAGKLTARPPGGHLNYSGAVPAANPGLDLAIRALRDFKYERMTVDVDYAPEGQLDLMVRLEGKNPDVEDGRPIHFNLNISQNVLTLLKSLRASERMSERVQQRLSR